MLTVLVKTNAEVRIVSPQAMVTSNDIGRYFLQSMAQMRRAIRIINSSRDVVRPDAVILFKTIIHTSPLNKSEQMQKRKGRRSVACPLSSESNRAEHPSHLALSPLPTSAHISIDSACDS